MSSKLAFALLSCALLGFRHGFDYDHLAAITDITSVQRNLRKSMRLGLLYALGHAATVVILGVMVVIFRLALPIHLDAAGERIVGATLVALGIYIVVDLFHKPEGEERTHQSRSRIAMLVSSSRYLLWRFRRRRHPGLERPKPFGFRYAGRSVFLIGALHGLGAETPSQLVLFFLAANLGGPELGFVGLLCFVAGLLCMNTLMTASAAGIFATGQYRPYLWKIATAVTVVYSFVLGGVFLFGASDRLPPLVR